MKDPASLSARPQPASQEVGGGVLRRTCTAAGTPSRAASAPIAGGRSWSRCSGSTSAACGWVHSDARAAESARAVDARAHTVSRDVVFGAGEYAQASPEEGHSASGLGLEAQVYE